MNETQQHRKGISLKEKCKIIAEFDDGASKRSLAKKYNLKQSTIQGIIRDKEKVIETFASGASLKTKRIRQGNFKEIEEEIVAWIQEKRRVQKIPVSRKLAMKKASEIAKIQGEKVFKASSGWMTNVKKRKGLVVHKISGEAASVNDEELELWQQIELRPMLKKYEPDNVYNADETAVYWKVLPDKTLDVKGALISGTKVSKARITALVCSNMSGTDKKQLLTIGTAKRPRCFNNVKVPVDYAANKTAWMTSKIFSEWLKKWDDELKKSGRKILLYVDNCTAHETDLRLRNITLKFLPKNSTSKSQPADQGIIKNLKDKYRSRLLEDRLKRLDSRNTKKFELIHGIRLLKTAWQEVQPVTIRNCFRHAGFWTDPLEKDDQTGAIEELGRLYEEMRIRGLRRL